MTNGRLFVYNREKKMACHCVKLCSRDCSTMICVLCLTNDLCVSCNSKTKRCMLVLYHFSTEVWGSLWDDRRGGSAASAAVHIWTGMAEIYSCCLQVWRLFCDGWQVNIIQLGSIHQLAQFPGLCCRKAKSKSCKNHTEANT